MNSTTPSTISNRETPFQSQLQTLVPSKKGWLKGWLIVQVKDGNPSLVRTYNILKVFGEWLAGCLGGKNLTNHLLVEAATMHFLETNQNQIQAENIAHIRHLAREVCAYDSSVAAHEELHSIVSKVCEPYFQNAKLTNPLEHFKRRHQKELAVFAAVMEQMQDVVSPLPLSSVSYPIFKDSTTAELASKHLLGTAGEESPKPEIVLNLQTVAQKEIPLTPPTTLEKSVQNKNGYFPRWKTMLKAAGIALLAFSGAYTYSQRDQTEPLELPKPIGLRDPQLFNFTEPAPLHLHTFCWQNPNSVPHAKLAETVLNEKPPMFQTRLSDYRANCLDGTLPSSAPVCMAEQAQLRQTEAFLSQPTLEVTDSDLVHLTDFFGKDTGLEGASPGASFIFMKNILQQLIASMPEADPASQPSHPSPLYVSPEIVSGTTLPVSEEQMLLADYDREVSKEFLETLLQKTEQGLQIAQAVGQDEQVLARTLKPLLHNLRPGEKFFFPGGWVGNPSGHGVVYEFEVQKNYKFIFRIYNAGSGLEYHTKQTVGHKDQFLTIAERHEVPLEAILRPEWLKMLKELSEEAPRFKKGWQSDDIYQKLASVLPGTSPTKTVSQDLLHSKQRSGTCDFASLWEAVRGKFPSQAASGRTHWHIFVKSLQDYVKKNSHRFSTEERSRYLFQKSLEECSRITDKRTGSLNGLERAFVQNELKNWQNILDNGKAAYLKGIAEATPRVSLDPASGGDLVLGSSESLGTPLTPATASPGEPSPYHSIDLKPLSLDPRTFLGQFEELNRHIKNVVDKNDTRTALSHFLNTIEKFPLRNREYSWGAWDHSFWDELPKEHIEKTIVQLGTLGTLAYQACLKDVTLYPARENIVEPRVFLALLKTQTLAVQLYEKLGLSEFDKEFFSPNILDRASNKLYFRTYDPFLDSTFEQLYGFWGDDRSDYDYYKRRPAVFPWYDAWYASKKDREIRDSKLSIAPNDSFLSFLKKNSNPQSILEFVETIKEKIPKASSMSEEELLLLSNFDEVEAEHSSAMIPLRRTLPSHFYALRDLTHSMRALMELPLNFNNPAVQQPHQLKYVGELPKTGTDHWGKAEIKTSRWVISSVANRVGDNRFHYLDNAHSKIKNEKLAELIGYSQGGFIRKTESYHVILQSIGAADLQTERAVRNLLSDRNYQTLETLKYFQGAPELLKDADQQTLFKLLMFDPGVLKSNIIRLARANEKLHFIAALADFTSTNYHYQRDVGNLETAAFFLHVNELFSRYIDHHADEIFRYHDGIKEKRAAFMDTRHEIREVLKRKDLPIRARSLFNQELALCYRGREQLSDQEVIELTHAAFTAQLVRMDSDSAPKENVFAIEQLVNKWLPSIDKLYSGRNKDKLLNDLVQAHTGSPLQVRWKPTPKFPFFTASNGYEINLKELSLDTHSGKIYTFPKDLYEHPLVIQMFGEDRPKLAVRIGSDQYEFEVKQGKYRVMKSNKELIIQKVFRQEGGMEDWQQYTPKQSLGKEFKLKGMITDHMHWQSTLNPNEITVTDKVQTPLYRIQYKGNQVQSIVRIYGKDDEQGLVVDDALLRAPSSRDGDNVSNWHFLKNFEDPGYVFLWNRQEINTPQLLEFPRFGISFNAKLIKGKQRFSSANFPGFYLAEKQHVSALEGFPHFLLLENIAGEQKVLIPNQRLSPDGKKSSLEPSKCHPERQLDTPSITKQTASLYSIDPVNGQLIPQTDEGRIHLAMIHLWKMDYVTALRYLKGTGSSLRLLNEEERQALSHLANLNQVNGDQDPRGNAVRLHAILLLLKDGQIRAREGGAIDLPDFKVTYKEYLDQLSNIPQGKLSIDDELVVLDAIPDKEEAMLNRLRALAPLKGKMALAYLSTAASEEFLHTSYQQQPSQEVPPISIKDFVSQDKPEPFSCLSAENFMEAYRSASYENSKPSILRPSTLAHLKDGYCLARGEETLPDYSFEKLTGIKKYDLQSFKRALNIMMSTADTDAEKMTLHLFDALITHPERFPSTQTFKHNYFDVVLYESKRKKEGMEFLNEMVVKPLQEVINEKYEARIREWEAQQKKSNVHSEAIASEAVPQIRGTFVEEMVPQAYQFSIRPGSTKNAELPLLNDLKLAGITPYVAPPVSHKPSFFQRIQSFIPSALMPKVDVSEHGLQEVFDGVKNLDPVTQKEFTKTAQSVALYKEALRSSEGSYQLENPLRQQQFADALQYSLERERETLTSTELSLLQKANKLPESKIARIKHWLGRLGGSGAPLTIDDLVELYWRQDATLFYVHNQALSPDDIVALQEDIFDYLLRATRVQHMERLSQKLTEMNQGEANRMSKGELNELATQAAALMRDTRHYDPSKHPEYIVMEYRQGIRLRPEQVEKLDLLDIRKGKVLHPEYLGTASQMIMGGGKSTVLLPELLSLFADGEHIAIGVIPEGLLPTVAVDLSKFFGKALKRSVQVLSFTENTVINEQTLRGVAEQLKTARDMRHILLMGSRSIESFYLKAIKHIHSFAHDSQTNPVTVAQFSKELDLIREILTLFRREGRVIVDEGDLIFNPRRERHLTFGASSSFDPYEGELITFLYEALLTDPAIKKAMTFEFSPGTNDRPFNRNTYKKAVVPRLITLLLKNNLGSTHADVSAFFKTLTEDKRAVIEAYLYGDKTDSVINAVRAFPPKVRDLLALGKEEIHVLLPLTCDKQDHMHYGRIPGKNVAVHFDGSNKPTKSDFQYYEAPSYTIQTYLKHGIPVEFAAQELTLIRTQAMNELKENPRLELDQTQAIKRFHVLCGGDSRFSLFSAQPEEIIAIVNQDIKKQLEVIRTFILPEVTFNSLSLSANPQIFSFLFEVVQAFTGTPWNADTYPRGLQIEPDNTVSGIIHSALWDNSQNKVHVITTPKRENFARDLIGQHPNLHHINAIIDIAGMARGIDNEEVARQLLALPELQQRNINGIVFYNTVDELMILEREKAGELPTVRPLVEALTPLKQRFTFYDQPHTTGADIQQVPDAVGLATIGKKTIQRDFLQGSSRFRKLKGLLNTRGAQRIEFALDHETESVIRESLKELTGKPLKGKIELKHLFLFTTYSQALLQGDNNYRALKHKMRAILQAEAFSIFLNPNVDNQCLLKFFREVEELFVDTNVRSPWELFGSPQESQDSGLVVNEDVNKWLNSRAFQAFLLPADMPRDNLQPSVKDKLQALAIESEAILPARISKASQGYGREIEKERETEKEKETEQEIERELAVQGDHSKRKQRKQLGLNIDSFEALKGGFYQPGEGFSSYKDLEKYKDVFDPQLFSTVNLTPFRDRDNVDSPYHPFGFDQKPVADVLFVKKPEGLTAIMLDLEDSHRILSTLYIDYPVGIYNFQLGFYSTKDGVAKGQPDQKITPDDLQADPDFIRLVTQAKFFNGEVNYTKEEMKVLETWIKEKGVSKMHSLFHDHILQSPAKSKSRAAFSGSRIYHLFKQLS